MRETKQNKHGTVKNQNQKEKEPTATTNNWTSECQRQDWHFLSHRRERKSTTPSNATILRAANSKCPLRKRI
jgi:hypothetical protein